jgi:hypothetical protein
VRNAESGNVTCDPLDLGAPIAGVQCFTDESLFCDQQTRQCTSRPDIGQACDSANWCRSNAFCENGLCTEKRTSGPCGQNGEACASTAYCDYATSPQCHPRKDRGETCGLDEQCAVTDRCAKTCRGLTIASKDTCS